MTKISPLLAKLIEENKIPKGRALVPGCGRGYDVTALATKDRYVLGLDISETAVKAARERRDALPEEACQHKPNADFQTTSFFELDASSEDKKFDFVYDYTFLCALDPSVRPQWAQKMAELVKREGELLTLVFPIRPPDEKGPPFAVSLELYRELLEPVGFRCEELALLPPELCHEGRDGYAPAEDVAAQRKAMGSTGVGRWVRL
jgi:ubiquinone/menaquinone biosynthesis C-methylase UbiE